MNISNKFILTNDSLEEIILNIEPENVFISLNSGERVTVLDTFDIYPVTLNCSKSEEGSILISIWPGDGVVVVQKNGIDVLDLM